MQQIAKIIEFIPSLFVQDGGSFSFYEWIVQKAENSSILGSWFGIALLLLVFAFVIAGFLVLLTLFLVLSERKIASHFQDRVGPMRVGPHGIFQTVIDMIKLLAKEDIIPQEVSKRLFKFAPYLVFAATFAAFAAIPFGRNIVAADFSIGIFYIIAISSLVVLGLIIAGWASNNKWSLLGALRSAAQMVSYEVPIGLSILAVVLTVSSLSMQDIVLKQSEYGILSWFIFRNPFLFVAFFIYFLSGVAEVNRNPFDIPEAESELVAGFHTEYSGIRFAFFFFAEYVNTFAISVIACTLFLGGWKGVFPLGFLYGIPGIVELVIKALVLVHVMMWFRWTLPRLRVDQLMNLCWKYFVPIAFINILGAGIWEMIFKEFKPITLVWLVIPVLLLIIAIISSISKGKVPAQTA